MVFFVLLLVLGSAWVISAWSFMLFVGMVHHDILPAVIPISYQTSLQITGVMLAFTFGFALLSGILREAAK